VEAEFASLESKVAQLVSLCERLRGESAELRRELAAAQQENRRLSERIEGARSRLEQLIARLPD
jgi:cell division protein ZapB